jgi:hypothetical protein
VTPPIDIFLVETGSVRWLETAASIEEAKARIQEVAVHSPGEYLLLNQKTGNKIVLRPNAANSAPSTGGDAIQEA